jgi:hypothetical protein
MMRAWMDHHMCEWTSGHAYQNDRSIDPWSAPLRVYTDLFLVEHGDLDQDHGPVCATRLQVIVITILQLRLVPAWVAVAALTASAVEPEHGDVDPHVEVLGEEHEGHGGAEVQGSCSSGTTTAYATPSSAC